MTEKTQINRRREEFPTLASGLHLLSHSLGPVPRAARESMLAYYDAWEHHTGKMPGPRVGGRCRRRLAITSRVFSVATPAPSKFNRTRPSPFRASLPVLISLAI